MMTYTGHLLLDLACLQFFVLSRDQNLVYLIIIIIYYCDYLLLIVSVRVCTSERDWILAFKEKKEQKPHHLSHYQTLW